MPRVIIQIWFFSYIFQFHLFRAYRRRISSKVKSLSSICCWKQETLKQQSFNTFVSDLRTIWASNAFYACCSLTSFGFLVCFVTTTVGHMSVYSSAAQLCDFQIGEGASIVVEIDSIRSVTSHICRKRLPIYSFLHMNNISRMYHYHLVDFLLSFHRRCTFM